MLLILALLTLALVIYALAAAPYLHDFPIDPKGAHQYQPGVRVRAGHLTRVLQARAAVRGGDAGYVRVR